MQPFTRTIPSMSEILVPLGKEKIPFELIFQDLDPMSPADSKTEAMELWREGLITMDEARIRYKLDPNDIYGSYFNFEAQSGVVTPPQHGGFNDEDEMEGPDDGREGPGEGG